MTKAREVHYHAKRFSQIMYLWVCGVLSKVTINDVVIITVVESPPEYEFFAVDPTTAEQAG